VAVCALKFGPGPDAENRSRIDAVKSGVDFVRVVSGGAGCALGKEEGLLAARSGFASKRGLRWRG
jgi:hypothetical protein